MKRGTQLVCLLLCAALLAGCVPAKQTEESVTAPDSSGAAVDFQSSPEPVLTEQALSEIKALGESPDDNYRTWYEIFVYSFCDSDGDGIPDEVERRVYGTSPSRADTDGDGIPDAVEIVGGTDPLVADTIAGFLFAEPFEPPTVVPGELNGRSCCS